MTHSHYPSMVTACTDSIPTSVAKESSLVGSLGKSFPESKDFSRSF